MDPEPQVFGGEPSNHALIRPTMMDRPGSIVSSGSGSSIEKYTLIAKYLHRRCIAAKWMNPMDFEDGEKSILTSSWIGVAVRLPDGSYITEPPCVDQEWNTVLQSLHGKVAFTMSSEITQVLIDHFTPFQTEVQVHPRGLKVPIVPNLRELAAGNTQVTKKSYMCVVRQEKIALIWSDSVEGILTHGGDVESILVGLIWGSHIGTMANSPYNSMSPPQLHSPSAISSETDPELSEKWGIVNAAIEREENKDAHYDPDVEGAEPPPRPFLLLHASVIGVAMTLVVFVEMLCIARLITEYQWDKGMIRFALVATVPVFTSFSLFFMVVIAGSLFQIFGPLTYVRGNSRFYSAKPPKRGRYPNLELPHITIQMPVYKEGLKGVIIPTVESLLKAIKYYEAQGGSASIYVNEDGLQAVPPDMAEARKAFYDVHNIGYCARPKHHEHKKTKWWQRKKKNEEDPESLEKPEYIRKGQFKKASNMNYCLDFSIRVEDELLRLIAALSAETGKSQDEITLQEETVLYERALQTIIDQDEGLTWAAGNVRIGEIILIIDSDTRVPEDCLMLGALEMYESPEVAILQHASGVMQVANNVFENGITYFTNLIYVSIQFAVGNGDCAPFVGHNAFLRWKAIQSVAFERDGKTIFWSDDHVSEDFDMSLRLQMSNFVVRLATYHEGGFKEGVSLTVYDELARWEKYAYGCNELVFNPFYKWVYRGPFTKLFWKFLFSNIKVTSKITILAYIGTYYAIAGAIPLTLVNYIMVGWFNDSLDQFYLTSWKIFVGTAVIFNVLSTLAFAMLRHRLGKKVFFWSLVETMKWTPMFVLFFGGISLHLGTAIICHFCSINMEWTATAKELETTGFRVGLDKIFRDFKYMYLIIVPIIGGMVYLGTYALRGYMITDFTAIVPLANQVGCHVLLPFALGLV